MGLETLTTLSNFGLMVLAVTIPNNACMEMNNAIRQAITNAGCPYHDRTQFLAKNICLMPEYHSTEPPENNYGQTNVDIDWWKIPQVLDIDEKRNKITLQLAQFMEWQDPRIKVNISAMPTMQYSYSYSKLPPIKVKDIWHPNLDMYTMDIRGWKSLYDPYSVSYTHLTLPTKRIV